MENNLTESTRDVKEIEEFFSGLVITKPINDTDFKTIIKELHVLHSQQKIANLQLSVMIEAHLSSIPQNVTDTELLCILKFFRLFAEDPTCKISKILCPVNTLFLFSTVIFDQLTSLIRNSKAEGHASDQKSASLLHKTVRLVLNLIKAVTSDGKTTTKVDENNSEAVLQVCDDPDTKSSEKDAANERKILDEIGIKLLNLLKNNPVTTKIDIQFNAGLAFCHLTSRQFLESLFSQISTTHNSAELSSTNDEVEISKLEEVVFLFTRADYLNTLSMCFGALRTYGAMSTDFLAGIAHAALAQSDNNIKEAENFGAARVLEIWMDQVVLLTSNGSMVELEKLSGVFPLIEIFIFTYLAGHIEAVKNCCRCMLGDLSLIYHRLDSKDNSLLKELLEKILNKPFHMKWVALAAVARKNPQSVIILDIWKDAAEKLLCAERTFKNYASEVYISLMKYTFHSSDKTSWIKTWIYPLFRTQPSQNNVSNWPQKKFILSKAMIVSENDAAASAATNEINLQQCILQTVVEAMSSASDLNNATSSLSAQPTSSLLASTESFCLVVECLKIGTELGIKMNTNSEKINLSAACENKENNELFRGVLPRSIFNSWAWHANPQIRLAAFSLVVETKKTSEIFAPGDFETIKQIFRYNLVSQNPAFRQQFLAYYKKLMRRLKDGRSSAARNRQQTDVDNYNRFLPWIWNFFINDGLFVGANFSRRCQSLTCLAELLHHFTVEDLQVRSQGLEFLRWLDDSYENNKIAAVDILSQIPIPVFEDEKFCNHVFKQAMTLLASVKPPESVTGRYMLVILLKKSSLTTRNILEILMTKLESMLESIRASSLLEVSATSPPYGVIRAIRLIIDTYHKEILQAASSSSNSTNSFPSFENLQTFSTRLLKFSLKLNEILLPVLGSEAPEGFLPDLNENARVQPENSNIVRSINAQMLLVSSWRSMKEICLLLTEVCVNFPFEGELQNTQEFVLSYDNVSSIGTHLVYLLMNLMHRGVFEQVFVGFKSFAARLKKSHVAKYNKMAELWLEDVMDKDKVGDKCTTRRSAGLPFIFQALLIPEANNDSFMNYWMERLMQPDPVMTVRIHSVNILRGLYRDANFGHVLMQWVPRGIQLAFRGLRAKDWAERNSGLMLFGAVIRRTFGPRLNSMSAPTFFRKFPQMYDYLLGEVKATASAAAANDATQHDNDLLYHVLLLFSCFSSAPGKLEEGVFKLWKFVPYIQDCGANRDVQVRTIAARAIVPFITSPEERKRVLENTLANLLLHNKRIRNNLIHGDVLQLCEILKLIKSYEEEIPVNLVEKLQVIIDIVKNTKCPTIFESFAGLSIVLADFHQQSLMSTAATMQRVTELAFTAMFPESLVTKRNSVVGLPDADSAVCKSITRFQSNEENISRWIQEGSSCLMEELMILIIGNDDSGNVTSPGSAGSGNNPISDDGTNSKLQLAKTCCYQDRNVGRKLSAANNGQLIKRYLQTEFYFEGQTDMELNYLLYFVRCDVLDFHNCTDMELRRVMDKLVVICQGDFGSIPCKAAALKFLARLAFHRNEKISKHKEIVCDLFLEWSDSEIDDELRLAVASSLPNVPVQLDQYCPMDFCKIWISLFKLGQDDETLIRCEALKKLSRDDQMPGCSLKCIELLVQVFLQQINRGYTVEGLWTLFGLLIHDDFVSVATIADDEEEDRLFDRSEMNLFRETVTVTRIAVEYLEKNKEILAYLKSQLSTPLSNEGYQFFALLTNTNLTTTSEPENCDNLTKLKDILTFRHQDHADGERRSRYDDQNDDADSVNLLCANNNDNVLVQSFIRDKVAELFLQGL